MWPFITEINPTEAKTIKTWNKSQLGDPSIDAIIARTALRDSYIACNDLKRAISEENHQRTRMSWIACLTYLRSVGHVLQKVDSHRSKWIKQASKKAFDECKTKRFENVIFWEFIENERNSVLKEYSAVIFHPSNQLKDQKKTFGVANVLIGTELYTPEEVVLASINWWEEYLEKVESEAARLKTAEKRQS